MHETGSIGKETFVWRSIEWKKWRRKRRSKSTEDSRTQ